MNAERLYFNGQLLDLSPATAVAKTLQVNDIASLDSRQASFTRSIDVPKTPNNIKIFDYLGIVGNDSNIPYQKNTANYYIGNECIIYEGFATLTETTTVFKLNIYDGIIDFYKSIENKTFSEINLSGITHTKTVSSIVNSWTGNTDYKYIIADYNGKSVYSASTVTTINTDYLIPSVNVKFLWDKIFQKYNCTYSGSVFNSPDFTNLYMTFPKGVESSGDVTVIYDNDAMRFQQFPNTYAGVTSLFLQHQSGSIDGLNNILNSSHFRPAVAGNYKFELTGMASPVGNDGGLAGVRCDIWLGKNSISLNANNVVPIMLLKSNVGGNYNINFDFACEGIVNINANETFCLFLRQNDGKNLRYVQESTSQPLKFKISKVEGAAVSFDNALQDFKIKDFVSEIVWRFGLTIFKDKYSPNYEFLTLNERLENASVVNWSSKFNGITSEKYVYGNYAQNNYLRYEYNDEKNDHKDGMISINNVNLDDVKNIIKSKIYAPEKDQTNYFSVPTNVYKLWDKEVNENSGVQKVNYKALDKRFYFLRSENKTLPSTKIGSETFNEIRTIASAPFESFSGLSFTEIGINYYKEIGQILNQSKLISAKFYLTASDVSNFDFRKLYHIDQLGGAFLVNKINNFIDGKLCDVELIKIEKQPLFYPDLPLVPPNPDGRAITLGTYFVNDFDANNWEFILNYTTTAIFDSQINVIYDTTYPTANDGQVSFLIAKEFSPMPTLACILLSTLDGLIFSDELCFTIPY